MTPVAINTMAPRERDLRIGMALPIAKPFSSRLTIGSPPLASRMYIGCGHSSVQFINRTISLASQTAVTVMLGNARMIAMSSMARCVGPSGGVDQAAAVADQAHGKIMQA